MDQILPSSRRRRRVSPQAMIAILGVGGIVSFVAGFAVFWGVGSLLAGGEQLAPGLSLSSRAAVVEQEEVTVPAGSQSYPVTPPSNPRDFRDLSYVPVKGIYVSSWVAGSTEPLERQLALADRTEINAMVIDVKDATGYVTYDTQVPLADELGLEEYRIRDMGALMAELQKREIVPIARIVCFKDPLLAEKRPEWGVRHVNGELWRDNKGSPYTNPYQREVWEYLVDVAEDAVEQGFREIQFDYVRFPSDGKISNAEYPGEWGAKEDGIAEFLNYARGRLEEKGAWVSADVFGLTVYVHDDLGIGQKIEKVSQNVDIVSPMIYPSHYYTGSYGIEDPNNAPYDTITYAMKDAGRRVDGTGATVRPWLQDFSLGGVEYGVAEVKAQIKAVEEQGYDEWLLWDPSVSYTEGALRSE